MSDPAVRLHTLRHSRKAMAWIIDRPIEECCALPIGSADRQARIALIAVLEGRRRRAHAAKTSAFTSLLKEQDFSLAAASSALTEPSRAEIERHDWDEAARHDRLLREQTHAAQVRKDGILKATARRVKVTVPAEPCPLPPSIV